MKFFVPGPDGDELPPDKAQIIWDAARKGAESDIGRSASNKPVYRLKYRHNAKDYDAKVGDIDALEHDLIMAIVDLGDIFSIRCRVRGVAKIGDPIIVGRHDASYVEYFD